MPSNHLIVIPFSSSPQSFPASGSFQMSRPFASGGLNIGVSASASVLPMNTQDWSPSPLEWTGRISLQSKGLSRSFSNTTVQKHQFFDAQLSSESNSHIHTWPLETSNSLWSPGLQHQASLSITNSQSLLKLISIEAVMPSSHLILCRPLLFPPSIFPSIRGFSNEPILPFRWPKYWSFSPSISSSNENSGLISLRMDWLDLLAVQGTLKSLLQHHNSEASNL